MNLVILCLQGILAQILDLSNPPVILSKNKDTNDKPFFIEDGRVILQKCPESFDSPRDILATDMYLENHPSIVYTLKKANNYFYKIDGLDTLLLKENIVRLFFVNNKFQLCSIYDYLKLRVNIFEGVIVPESVACFFFNFVLHKNTIVVNTRGEMTCLSVFRPSYVLNDSKICPRLFFKIEAYQKHRKVADESKNNSNDNLSGIPSKNDADQNSGAGDQQDSVTKSDQSEQLVTEQAEVDSPSSTGDNKDSKDAEIKTDTSEQNEAPSSPSNSPPNTVDNSHPEGATSAGSSPGQVDLLEKTPYDLVMESLKDLYDMDKEFFAPTGDETFDNLFLKLKDADLSKVKLVVHTTELSMFNHFSDDLLQSFISLWIQHSILSNLKANGGDDITLRFVGSAVIPYEKELRRLIRDLKGGESFNEDVPVIYELPLLTEKQSKKSKKKGVDRLSIDQEFKNICNGRSEEEVAYIKEFFEKFKSILGSVESLNTAEVPTNLINTNNSANLLKLLKTILDSTTDKSTGVDSFAQRLKSLEAALPINRYTGNDYNTQYGDSIIFSLSKLLPKERKTYLCDISKIVEREKQALFGRQRGSDSILDVKITNHHGKKLMLMYIDLDSQKFFRCFQLLQRRAGRGISSLIFQRELLLSLESIILYETCIPQESRESILRIIMALLASRVEADEFVKSCDEILSILKSNGSNSLHVEKTNQGNLHDAEKNDTREKSSHAPDSLHESNDTDKNIIDTSSTLQNIIAYVESIKESSNHPQTIDGEELFKAERDFSENPIEAVKHAYDDYLSEKFINQFLTSIDSIKKANPWPQFARVSGFSDQNAARKNSEFSTTTAGTKNDTFACIIQKSIEDQNDPISIEEFHQNYPKHLAMKIQQNNQAIALEDTLKLLERKLTTKPPSILKNSIYSTLPNTLLFGTAATLFEKLDRKYPQQKMLVDWLNKISRKNVEIHDPRVQLYQSQYDKFNNQNCELCSRNENILENSEDTSFKSALESNYTEVMAEIQANHVFNLEITKLAKSLGKSEKLTQLPDFEFNKTADVLKLLLLYAELTSNKDIVFNLIGPKIISKIQKEKDEQFSDLKMMIGSLNTPRDVLVQQNLQKRKQFNETLQQLKNNNSLMKLRHTKLQRYRHMVETALNNEKRTQNRLEGMFKEAKSWLKRLKDDTVKTESLIDQIKQGSLVNGYSTKTFDIEMINQLSEFALDLDAKVENTLRIIQEEERRIADELKKKVAEESKKKEESRSVSEADQGTPQGNENNINDQSATDDASKILSDGEIPVKDDAGLPSIDEQNAQDESSDIISQRTEL